MYILHIAFKNILREKRRTILTFMMFSFGIASYIIMAGMLEGTDRMSIKNLIEHETGHMMVRSSDYSDDHPYDEEGMLDGSLAQETIAFLETKQFVTGIAPRLEFLAELDNAKDALAVTAVGVDPDRDRTVFDFSQAIRSGDLQSGSCVIGRELAGDLNVKTGDIVYLTFKNRNGMYTSIDLEIVEEIVTTNPAINASTVYLSINEAREMLASDDITGIAVLTDDLDSVERYKDSIDGFNGGIAVRTWREQAEEYAALISVKKQGSSMLLLFIMIIGMVGIMNTMIMSVFQQKREIGTYKAIGMTDIQVRNIFVWEAVIIGFFGSLLGILLGSLANLYFVVYGVNLDMFSMGAGSSVLGNIGGTLYSVWVPASFVQSVVVACIGSLAASYFPAKLVLRMTPVDCLKIVR